MSAGSTNMASEDGSRRQPVPVDVLVDRARDVSRFCAVLAPSTDAHGQFPGDEFDQLASAGLLAAPLRRQDGGVGLGTEQGLTAALLDVLRIIGRGNLSVGRLYEGHVNAVQLIYLFASRPQIERFATDVRAGKLSAIWNTEMANGVRFTPHPDGGVDISGAKTFASGAGNVQRPLITGALPDGGWQMAVVPMEEAPVEIDESWWQPLGMRASASYRVDFSGTRLNADSLIGEPDDYHRQPWFYAGAIRFAAVQLGGAEALLEEVRRILVELDRGSDPYQRARVAEAAILVEGGRHWLNAAADLLDRYPLETWDQHSEAIISYVNMARLAIERAALDVLELAERSVGLRGMMKPQAFERLIRDLRMYLRQPAPDAARNDAGRYVLEHDSPFDRLWEDGGRQ